MKHLGDITKIDGHNVPPVDIVTGGSPCQDLSVAGKRAGLAGERSGLFMEQIRIIKEMRDESERRADRYIRPRFMVWENVPGAFSSNGGEDFRAVLEETVRVVDPTAVIPRYEGGWTDSGVILGRKWSVAWRVHDLQFWGCPQRRRRISLVADFGGQTAPEILFERESLPRDIEPSQEAREGTSEAFRGDTYPTVSFQERAGRDGGVKEYSSKRNGQEPCLPLTTKQSSKHQVYGMSSYESNAMKSSNPHSGIYEADTARTLDLNGANPNCNQGGMMIVEDGTYSIGNGQSCALGLSDVAHSLDCMHDQQAILTDPTTYSQDAYDKFTENDNSASLKACERGSEALVISRSDRKPL